MIEIHELTKIFPTTNNNEFKALDTINLKIRKGECVILKGVSGSGKSTLLSIIGTMSKPSSGAVLFDGVNYSKMPDDKISDFRLHNIGFIFQSYNLIEHLSAKENIFAPMICRKLSDTQKQQNFEYAKKLANFENKDDILGKDLSGGEKQRCAIARALVNNPDIIIADEPTANLDKENSLHFIKTMSLLQSLGKTIIIATHDEIFNDSTLFINQMVHLEYGKITNEI